MEFGAKELVVGVFLERNQTNLEIGARYLYRFPLLDRDSNLAIERQMRLFILGHQLHFEDIVTGKHHRPRGEGKRRNRRRDERLGARIEYRSAGGQCVRG